MDGNFAKNLRLLCSYTTSISEACRTMGINRQQFTKYLNGTARPSVRNLRVICDHFGVEEDELALPHGQFSEMVSLRPRARQLIRALGPAATHIDAMISSSSDSLKPYCGYYFYYYFTPSRPGMIRRSLFRINAFKGVFYTRLTERIQPEESPLGRSHFVRYVGVAVMLDGRIFVTDHNPVNLRSLSQTVLFSAPGDDITFLTGMTLGVQGRSARTPFAARVFLEYLGDRIDARPALHQTGIFESGSPHIPRHIGRMLASSGSEPQMLTALELPV